MLRADEVIALLGLEPLGVEGGSFVETYRCPEVVSTPSGVERALSTAIYYLLRAGEVSRLHRLPSDELFHFYCGDPVEMLLLGEAEARTATLGTDLGAGMRPQILVPRGTWQGCRLRAGGSWALLGTTVSPGFDYADFEVGRAEELTARFPACAAFIRELTPTP
jgi:hypothetical protein